MILLLAIIALAVAVIASHSAAKANAKSAEYCECCSITWDMIAQTNGIIQELLPLSHPVRQGVALLTFNAVRETSKIQKIDFNLMIKCPKCNGSEYLQPCSLCGGGNN